MNTSDNMLQLCVMYTHTAFYCIINVFHLEIKKISIQFSHSFLHMKDDNINYKRHHLKLKWKASSLKSKTQAGNIFGTVW
jgi:hypothetical protein